MGIYFSVECGGEKVELSVKSVMRSTLIMKTEENTLAKSNDMACKMIIVGQIDASSTKSVSALKELTVWAKQCNQKQDSYRKVTVEQSYAEFFNRKVIFPDARLLSFHETFLTDNSKFMEIAMEIEQKQSKLDSIHISYF
ncbi:hypothetical protein AAK894_02390 [Lachnospiraceae bacterium 46-61]